MKSDIAEVIIILIGLLLVAAGAVSQFGWRPGLGLWAAFLFCLRAYQTRI